VNANAGPDGRAPEPGAIARRIGRRRAALGLSENALATQAGMTPRYFQHLLVQGPGFDPGGFLRIAAALQMTYHELLEGRGDLPPGQSAPTPRPALIRLTTAECWDKLGTRGVGRVALPVQPGPAVFPVNYAVEARSILYRTANGGPAAPETGARVSFQVDRIDDRLSQGWSVLITGVAERIEDPAMVRRLTEHFTVEPWAGGDRPLWIRIGPGEVTGRHIRSMSGGS
jgi:nitroimidazol reductase NimA-like FMN-containing flavoprotein (pyridoxamine 5'-phosphate oxidase superfamily)